MNNLNLLMIQNIEVFGENFKLFPDTEKIKNEYFDLEAIKRGCKILPNSILKWYDNQTIGCSTDHTYEKILVETGKTGKLIKMEKCSIKTGLYKIKLKTDKYYLCADMKDIDYSIKNQGDLNTDKRYNLKVCKHDYNSNSYRNVFYIENKGGFCDIYTKDTLKYKVSANMANIDDYEEDALEENTKAT